MTTLTGERVEAAFRPHLQPGETVRHWAIGVRQPNLALLLPLFALAFFPGAIALRLLTRTYLVALTQGRLIALRVKRLSGLEVEVAAAYDVAALRAMPVRAKTGPLFTHIRIDDRDRRFTVKFHRAACPDNRAQAMAIADAIAPAGR